MLKRATYFWHGRWFYIQLTYTTLIFCFKKLLLLIRINSLTEVLREASSAYVTKNTE